MKILKIGAGKAVIKIPGSLFPIETFGRIHDNLHARVLMIESNIKLIIVSLELTSLRTYEINVLRSLISQKAIIPAENIWICVTHTFSAPHVRSENAINDPHIYQQNCILCNAIENAVSQALESAIASIREARIGFRSGCCRVNINRDVLTPDGWWLGRNESGISDKAVPVITFESLQGNTIAILYCYDVQSSVTKGYVDNDGYCVISSDLTGRASRFVEEKLGNEAVVLYCCGAAGDQAPAAETADSFTMLEELGTCLGQQVLQTSYGTECGELDDTLYIRTHRFQCPGQKIPNSLKEIRPQKRYNFISGDDQEVEVEIIVLAHIALIGLKPEICSITSMNIKKSLPSYHTMILTLVNGGAKYMADLSSYDRITYEAMNSTFGCGSAEILEKEVTKILMALLPAKEEE